MLYSCGVVALLLPILAQIPPQVDSLQTVAERSGYRATARHGDVVALCKELARKYPGAHYGELGLSAEGRPLPLLIVADPPVKTAAEAARSGKLVALVIGNIHAGEVCGKEALPMLPARSCATPHHPLLKDLILAVAPIYNADGNERVSKTNRPGQVGPEEGMGQRANARGLDLNRDFIKLEAPETRALVRFLNDLEPAPVHRHPHDQRLAPPLHDHLRGAEESRPATRRSSPSCGRSSSPRSRPGSRRRPAAGVLLRQLQSRPHEVDDLPRRGPVRHDLRRAAGTGSRSFPRPMPTRRSRTGSWPPATSSASA